MHFASRILICMSLYILAPTEGTAGATDIWFSPTDPFWGASQHWPNTEYMRLFVPGAPWKESASVVKAFEISKRLVLESDEADLREIVRALNEMQISLSVQIAPLVSSQACGIGVEAHGPADDVEKMATRLKSLGATVDFVSMDEPLWFGHNFRGGPGSGTPCTKPIRALAEEVAIKLRGLRRIYPQVVIGDIEPIGVPPSDAPEWADEVRAWIDSYNIVMGEPLGFFTADVVWQRPTWRPLLREIGAELTQERIPLHIIYNGLPSDNSDEAWTRNAVAHFQEVEGEMHIVPAAAVFQSWTRYPERLLPDSSPSAFTNLLLQYAAYQNRQHR